ncbi:hypothetical protein TNCT_727131 [Trichonephila clavata]|uniref:Reverse transcriptase domain-containing protein n=1 Tax=Trichonephila clavata TaxID=2740835 RepID=A0A8X6KBS5_TRICU|nr:hypothetical protein TNCT_727131 [Trichonephila clavata]
MELSNITSCYPNTWKARRDKCERFVAWLDIANAFGSIPHGVILSALRNCGVDQDFARLVQNIYTKQLRRSLQTMAQLYPSI